MTKDMPHLTKRGYSTNTAVTRFHKELPNEYLYGTVHAQIVEDGAFRHKIDFLSYNNFSECVDFAYWWSCIGKALRLQPAH